MTLCRVSQPEVKINLKSHKMEKKYIYLLHVNFSDQFIVVKL